MTNILTDTVYIFAPWDVTTNGTIVAQGQLIVTKEKNTYVSWFRSDGEQPVMLYGGDRDSVITKTALLGLYPPDEFYINGKWDHEGIKRFLVEARNGN